ncbi:interferon-stimulated 20 kDa exonuclease-like 2 [Synchiropus picturatus]
MATSSSSSQPTVNSAAAPGEPREAPATNIPQRKRNIAATSAGTAPAAPTKYLALDCEMVGAGPKGSINQLARCSIVSYDGDVVYDKFIRPALPVTDYRTRWSGIRHRDLVRATPYAEARKEILRLLGGKVVVGHAIHNDLKVLSYGHPTALTRDTSRIPLLNRKAGFPEKECVSLKRLTKALLDRDIQVSRRGHSSVEDAKATMELYKMVEVEWERQLATKERQTQRPLLHSK